MYGHAHLLLEPPCPCGSGKSKLIRSDVTQLLVCAACAKAEAQKEAAQ